MTNVSVIMPVYNVEQYVKFAINSVLNQTYKDFELIIVDDGSTDSSLKICRSFRDPRIRIISQSNRGLAGARNSGIRASEGQYIAFIDSDDLWAKTKLEHHVYHLDHNTKVGVSYSHSALINEAGKYLGLIQSAKTRNIDFKDIICRNPIGNGSSPIIRRSVLEESSFRRFRKGILERWYFDESLKQSEDLEYWLRIAVNSPQIFEGINKPLTYYRINDSGLSANLEKQLSSWHRMIENISLIAPRRIARWRTLAEAYQLRYLARRAIKSHNQWFALKFATLAIFSNFRILIEEPGRTLFTLISSILLWLIPKPLLSLVERCYYFIAKTNKAGSLENHHHRSHS